MKRWSLLLTLGFAFLAERRRPMARVWIARNKGNWSVVSITAKEPTWTRDSMWSMHAPAIEVRGAQFEELFGWVPAPGSIHVAEMHLDLLESENHE